MCDTSDDAELLQYPRVLVVPGMRGGCSCGSKQQSSMGSSCTCKCSAGPRSPARSPGCSNYLLKGGSRAAEKAWEERAARQEAAAWKDLKVANHALANELVRITTHGSKEKQSLQEEVVKLELLVQAQHDKLELLQGRLADATKQSDESQERHTARLKEVARRLKEEHLAKLKPLQELNEQLQSEVAARQQDSISLAAVQEQLGRTAHRLELEASGRAELWQRCTSLEEDLHATRDKLAAATKSLRRAEQQLERAAKLEQRLSSAQEALQAEQVAHSKLQADAALEHSQAALLKAEVEQVHQELASLRLRYEHAEQQRASLSLALTDAQAAAADAGVDARAAQAKSERLQQELEHTRAEADSHITSLRNQAAARGERLTAQHAVRMAQLQSELDAQGAAAADTQAALAAAHARAEQLAGQVESLRQLGDAAGSQLAAVQLRLEQLQADKEQQAQQLKAQLQAVQVQLLQRDAELAEATSTADSSSKAWSQEQARLKEGAAKWQEKALELQQELESKQAEATEGSKAHAQEVSMLQRALDTASSELADVRQQLSAVEAERNAAAKRSSVLMTQWEERDAARDEELAKLRAQVAELLAAGEASRCDADGLRQQLKAKDLELEHMTLALAGEQSRLAALRGQLGALEQEKAGEFEAQLRGMQELSAALQAEQQVRLEAQLELNRHKKKLASMEAEVQQQRAAMHQVLEAKSKAEEAAATSAAALSAAERKAKLYRGDSTALLSDYDTWVQNLLAKKSTSGSGGTGGSPGTARGTSSLINSSSGAATAAEHGSWAGGLQSPVREGGVSRSVSQLGQASPGGLLSPAAAAAAAAATAVAQQRDEDLERYDRIAALLESRNVGSASLTRALSGKAAPASPGVAAAGASRASTAAAGSRSPSGRVSPRPGFR